MGTHEDIEVAAAGPRGLIAQDLVTQGALFPLEDMNAKWCAS